MFRKKLPVLTATRCLEMEDLRQSVEVLSGQRVRIRQIDFNTGRAMISIGEQVENVSFFFGRCDLLNFSFWNEKSEPKEWYSAIFESSGEVRVIKDRNNLHKCGPWDMWWVGKSSTERWEVPLYLKEAEHCAKVRGLSLEEFLKIESM